MPLLQHFLIHSNFLAHHTYAKLIEIQKTYHQKIHGLHELGSHMECVMLIGQSLLHIIYSQMYSHRVERLLRLRCEMFQQRTMGNAPNSLLFAIPFQVPQLTISASVGKPVELELSLKKVELKIHIFSKFKLLCWSNLFVILWIIKAASRERQ